MSTTLAFIYYLLQLFLSKYLCNTYFVTDTQLNLEMMCKPGLVSGSVLVCLELGVCILIPFLSSLGRACHFPCFDI